MQRILSVSLSSRSCDFSPTATQHTACTLGEKKGCVGLYKQEPLEVHPSVKLVLHTWTYTPTKKPYQSICVKYLCVCVCMCVCSLVCMCSTVNHVVYNIRCIINMSNGQGVVFWGNNKRTWWLGGRCAGTIPTSPIQLVLGVESF